MSKNLKLLVITTVLMSLTACATSPLVVEDTLNKTLVDFPPIDEITSRGLGERLVAKGERTEGDALELVAPTQFNKREGEGSIMTCALTVYPISVFKRGVYPLNGTYYDCFGPVNYRVTLADGNTNWNCPGGGGTADICTSTDRDTFLAVGTARIPLEQDHQNIKTTKKAVTTSTNFVQEFLYNGRVNNQIKFVYREFASDLIRPAFSQEVQYDLADSNVVGFRNLRLEVIEANNTQITYKLLNNF